MKKQPTNTKKKKNTTKFYTMRSKKSIEKIVKEKRFIYKRLFRNEFYVAIFFSQRTNHDRQPLAKISDFGLKKLISDTVGPLQQLYLIRKIYECWYPGIMLSLPSSLPCDSSSALSLSIVFFPCLSYSRVFLSRFTRFHHLIIFLSLSLS